MSVTSQQVARLLTEDRRVRMLRVQKRSLAQVYGPVVHGRVWWVMETPQNNTACPKSLPNVEVRHCTEEELSTNYSIVYTVDGAI